jgi:SAM-dependent methyltransferase
MGRVAEINRQYYESAGVAELFHQQTELCPAEELILDSLKEEIKGQPLLEIGIGAGRITPYLTALTKNYIGIDCSQRMVDVARSKFNNVSFFVCAAENMAQFEDQRFAAVAFWGNGIDEAGNNERISILKEINRVLRKGGIFLLSSHNFDWGKLVNSVAFSDFSIRRGMIHLVRGLPLRLWIYLSCLAIRFSAWLNRRGYAIFPEYSDEPRMALPVYYIRKDAQIEQLMNAGFGQMKAFSSGGIALNEHSRRRDHNGRLNFEIYYVSRKS